MEKNRADAVITAYLQKIYGFAYKKAFSYAEAEDLAAEMTIGIYRSLLSREEIGNIDGYLWRICENVYARYVASVKKREGLSVDEIAELPYYEETFDDAFAEEKDRLRREIAFLSAQRRQIVFRFYYKNESIRSIASRFDLPEGTVKWHLNKARNELKEGFGMERKIGTLGINPVNACDFSHNGSVGKNGGPEYYLGDRLSQNIVYSVYYEPKNTAEIAEELGITPVFIEDRIKVLENSGYLVKTKNGKYTTFVCFSPRTYSNEQFDNIRKKKHEAAEVLVKEYVPLVRKAVSDTVCYIPGGNRQLLEAAAVFYGIVNRCSVRSSGGDLGKYWISDRDGGNYIASIELEKECVDPDYQMSFDKNYNACGDMWRGSDKYPAVRSWSIDSRFDSRTGTWKNNLTSDYEFLYEYLSGKLTDPVMNADKISRLRERGFLDTDGTVRIMVCNENCEDFFARIPELDEGIRERFAEAALEIAMQAAKRYPPQMQDLIISRNIGFIDHAAAVMALDLLYEDGTFTELTEKERITANLIMFSDILPQNE